MKVFFHFCAAPASAAPFALWAAAVGGSVHTPQKCQSVIFMVSYAWTCMQAQFDYLSPQSSTSCVELTQKGLGIAVFAGPRPH